MKLDSQMGAQINTNLAARPWPPFSKLLSLCALISVAFFIALCLPQQLRRRKFEALHGCKPCQKFPLKDPIFGLDFIRNNIKAFKSHRFLDLVCDRVTKAGPTWQVRVFLTRQSTFTADPENIKTILSLNFKDYKLSGRRPIMGPLLGRGIFTSDGSEWQHSRSLLRPSFAKAQVADLALVELHVNNLFKKLPSDASTVDLQPLFHNFTLDSATDFLFGRSTNTLTGAKKHDMEFARALRYSLDHMAFLLVAGRLRKIFQADAEFDKANETCQSYVDTFVEQVMNYKDKEKIPNALLVETDQGSRGSFLKDIAQTTDDKDKIRGELLSLLLAGRDTTASLLSSLFWELSRNPDVWKILCTEVKGLNNQKPTYEQLRELKYAKYCINETLRLYPPVPSSMKIAVCDTVLPRGGGPEGTSPIYIPKGRKVFWSIYSMHRRKDLWGEDADAFRPERWQSARPTWEFLAFNGGPRLCLGQQYAITEVLYVIVRFVQEFDSIQARDDLPWTEMLGLTVTPACVKVALQRRTS